MIRISLFLLRVTCFFKPQLNQFSATDLSNFLFFLAILNNFHKLVLSSHNQQKKNPSYCAGMYGSKSFSFLQYLVAFFIGHMEHLRFMSIIPGYYLWFEIFLFYVCTWFLLLTTQSKRICEYRSSQISIPFLLDNSPLWHVRCYCTI